MSIFKRLSATITGSLDQAISQIENQDAVVDAIVGEARQELAKAKVRLSRVEADSKKMKRQQGELDSAIQQWTLRAQRSGAENQDKAIECLRQRKLCQVQMGHISTRIEEHDSIRKRLSADVKTAESRVGEILNKQHMMRTRESAANAMKGVNAIESTVADDLSATFERWEVKVTESEFMTGVDSHAAVSTNLEDEFISIEEEEELKRQLSELLPLNSVGEEKGHE